MAGLKKLHVLAIFGACVFLALTPVWMHINLELNPPLRRRFGDGLTNALEELHHALQTMQSTYFELWLGTWPEAIDWTAAVMGTYVSGSLYSLTRSLDYNLPPPPHSTQPGAITAEGSRIENEINKYFSQTISYYFGQDAFSIRNQAFDDMLWVVLGWLENIRFIDLHVDAHYPTQGDHLWYGKQFTGAFAHRARIFYDLAKRGWDENDCGGGMTWNPRLQPYKNAITNELFISASISMYLYFPGDKNESPFMTQNERSGAAHYNLTDLDDQRIPYAPPHAKEYLRSAVVAYDWLQDSGMMNDQGLYIDGFHISRSPRSLHGICDQRNEMVFTYNQGVILSAQRGLWEGTGETSYLADGHVLIRNVIKATGYDLSNNSPGAGEHGDGDWHGLGRDGILEDRCDSLGSCSQDGQNFKGIFFHHLTLFCESLPQTPLLPGGKSHAADRELWALHQQSCKEYSPWVTRNAVAALGTRDGQGRFGCWWGDNGNGTEVPAVKLPRGAEDYRNEGLGDSDKWGTGWTPNMAPRSLLPVEEPFVSTEKRDQQPLVHTWRDLNDRGRGRTVETQGAGVAVVRAMWEFVFEHSASEVIQTQQWWMPKEGTWWSVFTKWKKHDRVPGVSRLPYETVQDIWESRARKPKAKASQASQDSP
jgi:hypothetical protein